MRLRTGDAVSLHRLAHLPKFDAVADGVVERHLERREGHLPLNDDLLGEIPGDGALEPAENERPNAGDEVLVDGRPVDPVVDREAAPESAARVEESRHGEIEQRPQLLELVLDRRTGEGELVTARNRLDRLRSLGVGILDRMPLVDNDIQPGDTVERVVIDPGAIEARDHKQPGAVGRRIGGGRHPFHLPAT